MRTEIKAASKAWYHHCLRDYDQIEAMTLADRIAVMSDGKLQQFATPQQVYDNPANYSWQALLVRPQ